MLLKLKWNVVVLNLQLAPPIHSCLMKWNVLWNLHFLTIFLKFKSVKKRMFCCIAYSRKSFVVLHKVFAKKLNFQWIFFDSFKKIPLLISSFLCDKGGALIRGETINARNTVLHSCYHPSGKNYDDGFTKQRNANIFFTLGGPHK